MSQSTIELYPDERENVINHFPRDNVMEVFVEYIFNNMPAHLIYLADNGWKLVGRAELCDLFQPLRSPDEATLSKEQIIEHLVKPALKFAIFSHRWFNNAEPTFQDMVKGEN
ncbi:hypothetical protein PAXRUDRAFT_387346, partial [Paxillus rubicundulus Ve08.2h10]